MVPPECQCVIVLLVLIVFGVLVAWVLASFTSLRKAEYSQVYGDSLLARSEPLARVQRIKGAFTPTECREIIRIAETQKWRTDRHASYPTTDIATCTVPDLEKALLAANSMLLEQSCSLFGFQPHELWLRDQFVVKYSQASQRSLKAHRDASTISYIVALNDSAQFMGGGTAFFTGAAEWLNPQRLEVGEAILFCGKRLHEGRPVTSGTRYIVTGFIDVHADSDTIAKVTLANRYTIRDLIGPQSWSLPPYMLPTRPYLRANTYRLLGTAAAERGDLTALAKLDNTMWPNARLDSILNAARRIIKDYGTNLGESRMHELFHYHLTHPSICASTACHMSS